MSVSDRVRREREARRRKGDGKPAFDHADVLAERARWDALAGYLGPPSGVTLEHQSLENGPRVALVTPPGAPDDCVVLHLHPGGYVQGSLDLGVHNAARFALAGPLALCTVGYRRAPEHPFPAALDDALAALAWLQRRFVRVGVLGESAGGGLALSTLVAARDRGQALPTAAAAVSPWVDLRGAATGRGEDDPDDPAYADPELTSYARMYAGDVGADHPLVSPVLADLTGLPPLLIVYGEYEMLATDSEQVIANAARDGVRCDVHVGAGADHCFTTNADTDEVGRVGVDVVARWLLRELSAPSHNM